MLSTHPHREFPRFLRRLADDFPSNNLFVNYAARPSIPEGCAHPHIVPHFIPTSASCWT